MDHGLISQFGTHRGQEILHQEIDLAGGISLASETGCCATLPEHFSPLTGEPDSRYEFGSAGLA
jgi:hypothetical protein